MARAGVAAGFYALLLACFALPASPALSQDVVLSLNSDNVTISGKLLNFDGDTYLIETKGLGVVRVKADTFRCLGAGCPAPTSDGKKQRSAAPSHADAARLRISGSNTMGARLMPRLVRDYAQSLGATATQDSNDFGENDVVMAIAKDGKPLTSVALRRHGSATAFAALAAGEADLGMSSRPINDQELQLLAKAGFPNLNRSGSEHVIGLDGLLVIVSPKNNVAFLSLDEIAKIFAGEIKDWSAVGGDPAPIKIYARDSKSGTFDTFNSLVLKPRKKEISPNAKRLESNAGLAWEVASDPAAIGVVSYGQGALVKPILIKGSCGLIHSPTEFAIKAREYPLSRKLFLYTTQSTHPYVAGLIDYAISPAAEKAVEETGFVSSRVIAAPFDDFRDLIANALNAAPDDFNLDLMRQLRKELGPGKRLSANLRFDSGAPELDSESAQTLFRVAAYLEAEDLGAQKIVMAGFSDSHGAFDKNRALSLKRAESARDALIAASNGKLKRDDIDVRGYGELMPIACNDSEAGRQQNRRVEVWLVPTDRARPVVLIKQL